MTSAWTLTFEIHNSKILDAYDKNCRFCGRAKSSYFIFKNGQETGTEFIALWRRLCVQVCLHLAIEEKFRS